MLKFNRTLAVMAGLATLGVANAAPTIDGTISASEYGGSLVAVQLNATQFGNCTTGLVNDGTGGSELCAMYVTADSGFLYIGITGNMETNYNKFSVFFDSIPGGQNQLVPPASEQEFGNFKNMVRNLGPFTIDNDGNPIIDPFTGVGTNDGNLGPGLKFDAGFFADFMTSTAPDTNNFYNHFMKVGAHTPGLTDDGFYLGKGDYSLTGALADGDALALGTLISLNNSNVAGVSSDQGNVGDPLTATTGIEFKIPVSVLGGNLCDLKIMAFQNGGGMDFASNQFLPSLPAGTGNLGNPRAIDLTTFAGTQHVTVLPSVSGTVNFVGSMATAPTTVNYEWLDANGAVIIPEQTTLLGAGNSFKVCGPVSGGSYGLRLKFPKHTSESITVNTVAGAVTGQNYTLYNGDIDGDGEVGPGDFEAVVAQFGNAGEADVDADGEVGPSDFEIIVANFGIGGS
jgi:hypothetical protein